MDQMKGLLVYKDIEYPFLYCQSILSLFPPNQEILRKDTFNSFQNIFSYKKEQGFIERIHLFGKNSKKKCVDFGVSEEFTNDNGFLSTEVFSCFEYDETTRYNTNKSNQDIAPQYKVCKNTIHGIYVMGDEINYFLNAQRTFKGTLVFDETKNI